MSVMFVSNEEIEYNFKFSLFKLFYFKNMITISGHDAHK